MATKTKFSWKRKTSEDLSKVRPSTFTEDNLNEDNELFEEDWRASSKRSKLGFLEDRTTKSARLKNEGVALAQLERFLYLYLGGWWGRGNVCAY